MICSLRSIARHIALALLAGLTSIAPALGAPRPVETLIGDAPVEVRARLGEPALIHAEGQGALWTYRFEDCALMVAYREGPDGLRVTSVLSGPRRRAETPPTTAECLQSGMEALHAVRAAH